MNSLFARVGLAALFVSVVAGPAEAQPNLGLRFGATPLGVRAVYPDAFTVPRVVDAGMDLVRQKHDELVAGVRSGDILLYRTWFNDEYDGEVKRIYQDAKINP
jgi:hypothetical protein